jgi:hypothetical protein
MYPWPKPKQGGAELVGFCFAVGSALGIWFFFGNTRWVLAAIPAGLVVWWLWRRLDRFAPR